MNATRWWQADRHAERRDRLLLGNRIKASIRDWFEAQGFVETETAILQRSPGNETHLHAFETELITVGGERSTRYLRTSPEFAAKKLVAAGERQIFEFARVFRNRERGPLHAPEFTMLEWYRADADYDQIMSDAIEIMRLAARVAAVETVSFNGRSADPCADPERLSVAAAFRRDAGIDLPLTLNEDGSPRVDALAAAAVAAGVQIAADDDWSDIFSRVLAERVEPNLGNARPTLLVEYPAPEAALARPMPTDPRFSERFELFVAGVEIANGFGELTDEKEQRRRFEASMNAKELRYSERYPIDEDFMAALALMPPTSGAALGFDRLLMMVTKANSVDQVIWTPL